jgi:hypothetical protein
MRHAIKWQSKERILHTLKISHAGIKCNDSDANDEKWRKKGNLGKRIEYTHGIPNYLMCVERRNVCCFSLWSSVMRGGHTRSKSSQRLYNQNQRKV